MRQQQQPASSWWIGRDRADHWAYAQSHAIEMSKAPEARSVDSLQGIRQSPPKTGARSAIRLES